jgi:hypothetical protein
MATPRPLRIVKTTLVAYGLALFATAPFTGVGTPEQPATAATPMSAQLPQTGPGVDVVAFASPVSTAEIMAALPAGARVVSVAGRTADGYDSGFTVPDGMSLGTALAMYGASASQTPVVGIAVAHDDAVLAALRTSFAGRLA